MLNEDANNFLEQLKQLNIELIDFIKFNDFFNSLATQTKIQLRREAYEKNNK